MKFWMMKQYHPISANLVRRSSRDYTRDLLQESAAITNEQDIPQQKETESLPRWNFIIVDFYKEVARGWRHE